MNKKCKQHYLYIDGKAVPVTEKVYRAFWHYEDIKWYSTPQYTEVFPALSQIQVEYLRSQTKALCDAAEALLKQVERKNSA